MSIGIRNVVASNNCSPYFLQEKSADLTKFNETVSTLKRVSDADGVQEVDDKQRDLNNRWNNLTITLQRQRAVQEKLATAWNKFNFDLAAADTQLSEFEEQANRIDKTVRSKQQLLENGNQIQVSPRWCHVTTDRRTSATIQWP